MVFSKHATPWHFPQHPMCLGPWLTIRCRGIFRWKTLIRMRQARMCFLFFGVAELFPYFCLFLSTKITPILAKIVEEGLTCTVVLTEKSQRRVGHFLRR